MGFNSDMRFRIKKVENQCFGKSFPETGEQYTSFGGKKTHSRSVDLWRIFLHFSYFFTIIYPVVARPYRFSDIGMTESSG